MVPAVDYACQFTAVTVCTTGRSSAARVCYDPNKLASCCCLSGCNCGDCIRVLGGSCRATGIHFWWVGSSRWDAGRLVAKRLSRTLATHSIRCWSFSSPRCGGLGR